MGYQETIGATSREINPVFATDKTVNQGDPGLWGVQELTELYRPMGGCAGEGGAERREGELYRIWYKRDLWHVKWGWSVCLPGWALNLIIRVYLIILYLLLKSSHNCFTLSAVSMCAARTQCQLLVRSLCLWVEFGVRSCHVVSATGAIGSQHQLLEQVEVFKAVKHYLQDVSLNRHLTSTVLQLSKRSTFFFFYF